jgi:hypothetical protein
MQIRRERKDALRLEQGPCNERLSVFDEAGCDDEVGHVLSE